MNASVCVGTLWLSDVDIMVFSLSKVLRPEKLAAHVFEVDEDVEKDEVHPLTLNYLFPLSVTVPY